MTVFNNISCQLRAKENLEVNAGHNVLRLFDILPNFPFSTGKARCGYL